MRARLLALVCVACVAAGAVVATAPMGEVAQFSVLAGLLVVLAPIVVRATENVALETHAQRSSREAHESPLRERLPIPIDAALDWLEDLPDALRMWRKNRVRGADLEAPVNMYEARGTLRAARVHAAALQELVPILEDESSAAAIDWLEACAKELMNVALSIETISEIFGPLLPDEHEMQLELRHGAIELTRTGHALRGEAERLRELMDRSGTWR